MCSNYSAVIQERSFRLSSMRKSHPNPYSELRRVLSILIALLALTHSALAQDTSKIPTLQLWYEAKGISSVSYLENFDVANGGAHAIAVNRNCGETWYLGNGRVDTANKFCWGRALWVAQADFNGDGIMDYIDDNRNVFQGVTKDAPPRQPFVTTYKDFQMPVPGRQNRFFVDDFNGDGKQDMLIPGLYNFAKMLVGNTDLTKMSVLELPNIPNTAYSLQYIVGAWRDSDGSNKMVVYQQTDTSFTYRTEAFFLYSFQIEGDKVSYTALDTTTFKDFKDKWTPYYFYEASFVWHSKDGTKHTLIAGAENGTDMYALNQSSFNFRWRKKSRPVCMGIIDKSLNNPNERGSIFGYVPFVYFYDGNPAIDTTPQAWIPLSFTDMKSISDVNNDGFFDYVVYHSTYQTVKIYLGHNSTVNVQEHDILTDIILNNNQPCSKDGTLLLQIGGLTSGDARFQLFSLEGRLVADLGSYIINDATISIPLARYALSSGMYNLRCSVGKQIIDKGLIITE